MQIWFKIKRYIKRKLQAIQFFVKYFKEYAGENNLFFLIGTEDFGNIGDHHIAISELSFLEENFPGKKVFEIPASIYFNCKIWLRHVIKPWHILFLTGGGNFGNEYRLPQRIRRDVVTHFPKCKIICFPVTIYYTLNKNGKKELERDKVIFNRHKKFLLMVRDSFSYKNALDMFAQNKVVLVPDIVMTSSYSQYTNMPRKGVILCIRNDRESKISSIEREKIKELCLKKNLKVTHMDTQLNYSIPLDKRNETIENTIAKFLTAELVITDRLHGMIFSAITCTPCIVLPNYNHKVAESSKMLEKVKYVQFLENTEHIEAVIDRELSMKQNYFNVEYYEEKFKGVCNWIQN